MDMYGFYTGREFFAYEYLGAHITPNGVIFRTFAPGAAGVGLKLWIPVSEIQGTEEEAGEAFEEREVPMNRIADGNFFEAEVPGIGVGVRYEYRIFSRSGGYCDHCDPYGFGMELRPNHKSVVASRWTYAFQDDKWMRSRSVGTDCPVNIYELHAGSWRKPGEEADAWYRYDELAELLVPYLKKNGYNYVEFLPLSEHPCDESWGYQNTGFFAPTSRYGTGDGLKKLIDVLHQNGIGAILDFVPVHFAVDAYGLAKYDGTELYEYPHADVGVSEWGSYNFMHSRGEVRSFLQSAANYWLKEFHFDGLRMDAISRIIYWHGDERRGVNGNAVDFIKVMNQGVKDLNPGCMLIAEDSTNYPNVTRAVCEGGLGFDYKWDMGWMHDTLEYFQTPPAARTEHYHKLTFSMMYYYQDRYLLPYSHDEVVHGKATIVQKMHGDYEGKFPQARAMYLYMMVHPGKKLNFMGNEIGQLREWDEKREQDWDLRKYPMHDSFYAFMKELNRIYLESPALYAEDYENSGFEWIDCHQEARCIYAIRRSGGNEEMAAVFNFSDQAQEGYTFELPEGKSMELILHTDWERFSGSTKEEKGVKMEEQFTMSLPPFSGVLLKIR